MKTLLASLIAVFLCIHLHAQQTSPLADSNNLFAFKLYNQVKKDKKENLFFSPFSIYTVLAMTYTGARNETEKQMANTMHFNTDQAAFHQDYKTFLNKIEGDTGKNLTLGIANAIWVANSFKLLAPFSETISTDYNSEAKKADFSNSASAEQTRKEINAWVEQKTNNKIQELIQPGILGIYTRLVLVNAIYYKGNWRAPFSKDSTKEEDFHKTETRTTKAKFMHNTSHFRYYEDDVMQAIELTYTGNATSLVVFLPKETGGIDAMENQLDYSYYKKIIYNMHPEKVILALPKFKTTTAFELNKTLESMGMPNAFNSRLADFSGISHESLSISNVIHKAFVDVNEQGTEAAAATGVVAVAMAVGPRRTPTVHIFVANHPFIFAIRDNATGCILFMGKIMDPTKE